MFKKVTIFLSSSIFLFCFFSCANSQKLENDTHSASLKAQAENLYKQTQWAQEIEQGRLTQDISSIQTVDKSVKLTPLVLINSNYSKNLSLIYPSLEGFTSLDLTDFSLEVKALTQEFSLALCDGFVKDSLFLSEDIFEGALFFNELKEAWPVVFEEEFPNPNETSETEQSDEKSKTANDYENSSDKKTNLLFSSFIIGSPFEMNRFYEVPVRFLHKDQGYVDVMLFFFKKKDFWKINQLQILKMERVTKDE